MRKNLTKKERIGKRSDLKYIFASGKRISCKGAKILYVKNDLAFNRFAVALVRKYGNAVERNRSKRFMREIYRDCKYSIIPGVDIVVVLYPGDFSFSDRKNQFFSLLKRGELVQFN